MTPVEWIVVVLLALVIFSAWMLVYRHRHLPRHLSPEDKGFVHLRWQELQQQAGRGGPAHLRQAIIQADTLVDHCLKRLGVPGDTFADRLRASRSRFSDYNGLWRAHKTRNQVVHEADKELLSFETKQMLAKFERALKDLGAL